MVTGYNDIQKHVRLENDLMKIKQILLIKRLWRCFLSCRFKSACARSTLAPCLLSLASDVK